MKEMRELDSVTAGLVGTIIGATVGPIGAYVNGALAPQAAISLERRKVIYAERKEAYGAISAEIDSLQERVIGCGCFLAPDPAMARNSRRALSLWASKNVSCSYEVYRFALASNSFFRLKRETVSLNDRLVAFLLGASDEFLRDYREVDHGLRGVIGRDLDVHSWDSIVVESSRDVVRNIRRDLGLR